MVVECVQFEVRKEETGEVMFRDTFSSPISAILRGDYRNDGAEEVIVCSLDGEVRGYLPVDAESDVSGIGANFQKEALERLNQKKQV